MGRLLAIGAWFCRVGFPVIAMAGSLQACAPESSSPAPGNRPIEKSVQAEDDPAVYRGAAIASHVCAQCHEITTGGGAGPVQGAPSFVSVVNRPETTHESLWRWLSSSHPTMPNYIFNSQSIEDLVAYIMTLKSAPR